MFDFDYIIHFFITEGQITQLLTAKEIHETINFHEAVEGITEETGKVYFEVLIKKSHGSSSAKDIIKEIEELLLQSCLTKIGQDIFDNM